MSDHADHIAELRTRAEFYRSWGRRELADLLEAAADWTAELDAANARLRLAADIIRSTAWPINWTRDDGSCAYCGGKLVAKPEWHTKHALNCLKNRAERWLKHEPIYQGLPDNEAPFERGEREADVDDHK